MRIEKDTEWNRLEGRVGQLRRDLREAEAALSKYMDASCAKQLGLTQGETLINAGGDTFLAVRVEGNSFAPWVWGAKIRKDGKPSEKEQRIYGKWEKVG